MNPTNTEKEPILERVRDIKDMYRPPHESWASGWSTEEIRDELFKHFPEIATEFERLYTENQQLKAKINELPDILYRELDGHKGQARRIALQHLSTSYQPEGGNGRIPFISHEQ